MHLRDLILDTKKVNPKKIKGKKLNQVLVHQVVVQILQPKKEKLDLWQT